MPFVCFYPKRGCRSNQRQLLGYCNALTVRLGRRRFDLRCRRHSVAAVIRWRPRWRWRRWWRCCCSIRGCCSWSLQRSRTTMTSCRSMPIPLEAVPAAAAAVADDGRTDDTVFAVATKTTNGASSWDHFRVGAFRDKWRWSKRYNCVYDNIIYPGCIAYHINVPAMYALVRL